MSARRAGLLCPRSAACPASVRSASREVRARHLSTTLNSSVIYSGIDAESVESMERKLVNEVLREAEKNDGRVLLHDEVEDGSGGFTVTSDFFTVGKDDVLTPAEMWQTVIDEGYQVGYSRIVRQCGSLVTDTSARHR